MAERRWLSHEAQRAAQRPPGAPFPLRTIPRRHLLPRPANDNAVPFVALLRRAALAAAAVALLSGAILIVI